ncbi:plasmid mobilization protein [Trinickia fusca]|uniref:Uncharacterized protein n=1 Tax=Trinickia fusca TaxID=2419777 RepID=A0A494XPR7_9BURK|nr:hypothetical protein [Trinickia fusca]RKP52647.1 hypothetical protein D7S89_03870 [Trinickia fusca]
MKNSSERLVVFVTPAQKRVITATAQRLGVSVSELLRRALLAFDTTGESVRAASIVDRLGEAARLDALNDTLKRIAHHSHPTPAAHPATHARQPLPQPAVEPGAAPPLAAKIAQALEAARETGDEGRDAQWHEEIVARVIAQHTAQVDAGSATAGVDAAQIDERRE